MTQYAYFDHTASQPAPVLGWYDTDIGYANLPDASDLLPVTADQWTAHFSTLYVVENGELTAAPDDSAAIAAALFRASAQSALDASDITAGRCFKAGVAYPAEWQTYDQALRAIVRGTDTMSTTLPTRPAYPAGT